MYSWNNKNATFQCKQLSSFDFVSKREKMKIYRSAKVMTDMINKLKCKLKISLQTTLRILKTVVDFLSADVAKIRVANTATISDRENYKKIFRRKPRMLNLRF